MGQVERGTEMDQSQTGQNGHREAQDKPTQAPKRRRPKDGGEAKDGAESRRMSALLRTLQAFEAGDFSVRMPTDEGDETWGEVAWTLNRVLATERRDGARAGAG